KKLFDIAPPPGGLFGFGFGGPGRPGGEFGGRGPGPQGNEANPELEAKALAILSTDQKEAWKKLIGASFTFPAPQRMGPPMGEQRKILAKFDSDTDGKLNREERIAAREFLKMQPSGGRGPGGFGGMRGPRGGGPGPGGPGGGRGFGPPGTGNLEPATPGPKVSVSDVKSYPDEPLYSDRVIRTLFLNFESDDWEEVHYQLQTLSKYLYSCVSRVQASQCTAVCLETLLKVQVACRRKSRDFQGSY
ncbi:MAG: hypothetical protein ACOVQM_21065, partial [Pirellula sp.]